MIPTTPTHIGRFEVLRLLGQGAQGRVFLANDPQLNRRVAVKALREVEGEAVELLRREAHMAARLRHPNLIPLHEMGMEGAAPFLVFEFVEGVDLHRMLKGEGRLAAERAVELVVPVARALAEAHRRGVVHRDIKPANILMDREGRPRLMDFGVARLAERGSGPEGGGEAQVLVGSSRYLAPEVIGGQPGGAAADLFALGLVLYELLAGRPAYDADNELAVLYRIANEPPPPLERWVADPPPPLVDIIDKALAREPAARFASADAFASALEAWLSGARTARTTTINFLLQRMERNPDFPSITARVQRVRALHSLNEEAWRDDVRDAVIQDVALTARLLRLANSGRLYRGQVDNLSKAISVLGFDTVRAVALAMLVESGEGGGERLVRIQERALGAAVLAHALAEAAGLDSPDALFVAALLADLGELLVAHYLPEEYDACLEAWPSLGRDAARSVLGLDFEALGLGVARHWELPDSLLLGLRAAVEPGGELTSRLLRAVHLIAHGDDPAERRGLINEAAGELGIDDSALGEALGRAVEAYRAFGEVLIEPTTDPRWLGRMAQAPELSAESGRSSFAPPPPGGDAELFARVVEVVAMLGRGRSSDEVIEAALALAVGSLGYTNALYADWEGAGGVLLPRGVQGGGDSEWLAARVAQWRAEEGPLAWALQRGEDVMLAGEEVSRLFPGEGAPGTLLLLPLSVEGRRIGVLYLDVPLADAVEPTAIQCASLLRHQLEAALRLERAARVEPARERSAKDVQLEASLHRALRNGEFVLHFQPQFQLPGREVAGFEALLRWNHPRRGVIGPARLVSFAERVGMISTIDRWVAGAATPILSSLPRECLLALNISARELRDPTLAERLERLLEQVGVEGGRLELEIPGEAVEEAVRDAGGAALGPLASVRRLGVKVAVEIGAGELPVRSLERLCPDTLKVRDLPGLRAVVTLADRINARVVAQGVENAEQLARIEAAGVRYAQGYFLAEPAPMKP